MDIYQQNILDHYKNPHNYGRINNPTKSSKKANPSCGDKIVVDVIIEDDKIKDIKFEGTGCAISVASASMITDRIQGMRLEDVKKLTYEDVREMLGVSISLGRIKCAVLALDTIKTAI